MADFASLIRHKIHLLTRFLCCAGADPGFFSNVAGPRNGGGGRVTKVRVMFEYVSEEFEALLVMVIGLSGV